MNLSQYQQVRNSLSTGDLLLFSGTGFYSRRIKWHTKSPYTHVATIIRLGEVPDMVFIAHALVVHGVTFEPASRYLANYRGKAWWLPIDKTGAANANPHYRSDMFKYLMPRLREKYDIWGALARVIPFFREDETASYCSELVARTRLAMGLFNGDVQMPPRDIPDMGYNLTQVPLF